MEELVCKPGGTRRLGRWDFGALASNSFVSGQRLARYHTFYDCRPGISKQLEVAVEGDGYE